jgi:hypothetical protein
MSHQKEKRGGFFATFKAAAAKNKETNVSFVGDYRKR